MLRKTVEAQELDVMPGVAGLRQIGQELADDRGELEAVSGAGGGHDDLRISRQQVEDEVLVRGPSCVLPLGGGLTHRVMWQV